MEPQLPAPHTPEQGSPAYETQSSKDLEHFTPPAEHERSIERPIADTPRMVHDYQTSAPLIPPSSSMHTTVPSVTLPTSDSPATASDDDLIEKEWVEKAKRVIAQTRDDPYAQEKAVSRLQADYLNKRYGKIINLPSEL